MLKSLLAPFCIAPILIAGLLHLPGPMLWAGCAAIVLLSFVLAHPEGGVETGAADFGSVTLDDLQEELDYENLPIYLAGVSFGVMPALDWYTAQVDGKRVLVLETVEMPHGQ